MISLALYLSLVISPDTYAFDCKNVKCRIGGSYLQEKSLPLLFLETLWSCHGESGKWKFERTVTLTGRWPKQICIILNEGYIEMITWREIALVQCLGLELINRHGETSKQVIIIKRIKKTNIKTGTITFLEKNSNFDHETGH